MTTVEKVLKFCDDALIFYRKNPAVNDYQFGYEAAIERVMEFVKDVEKEPRK